mmetsp:Transcript_119968/g.344842  ORF Transcript_119968/g.344842 Transcript_119968/m.344842 type:complete len:692 (-) Transcript_119968:305-2380(-)|eukprot:CAMPEP_0170217856 /NCGR_PEP_ID=MMETSP0116_2-20130129/8595_1 /TAXON_ID=400756 /ORGANISM="Durinskia baltica, Strain CSIRO CS-38" /LENGTH=691 /DNA_ID=CAMNT_0010468493 /DNA_START=32 /DNA_END=2107 /DNA_ORIENTATION=+
MGRRSTGLLVAAVAGCQTLVSQVVGQPVFGGNATNQAFQVWLSNWRNYYCHVKGKHVPHVEDKDLPKAFQGHPAKEVTSDSGAASGVVTEGMGYALMIEGMLASTGDAWAKNLSLSLARSWMGMVQGGGDDMEKPLGGTDENDGSATKVDVKPYGVSAIPGVGPAGVATWKFPRKFCYGLSNKTDPCHGSATDGDEDAILGLVYLAKALEYPADFVDMTVRSVIAFASADLGFPDMFRTLPDGTRVYVAKAGSQWGGLTPPAGKFMREKGVPDWCTVPAYFAPANYRTFRDFLKTQWKPEFDKYLPPHLNGTKTALQDLVDAFEATITAGYNILYYSSCESGTVSNWVGVKAACKSDEDLSCEGVPWEHTPYVGAEKGNCSASGTGWGRFGADASRMPWRIAMDYALYSEETEKVRMFDRSGKEDKRIKFNARYYLNRIATQYKLYGKCDGGVLGDCDCDYGGCKVNFTQAFPLSAAFEINTSNAVPTAPTVRAPGITCDNVPHIGQSWWAGFMSWPTFTAFIAPYREKVHRDGKILKPMNETMSRTWLESLANICDYDKFNAEGHYMIKGATCQRTYFHVTQEVLATFVMSGSVPRLAEPRDSHGLAKHVEKLTSEGRAGVVIMEHHTASSVTALALTMSAIAGALALSVLVLRAARRRPTGGRATDDYLSQCPLVCDQAATEDVTAAFA